MAWFAYEVVAKQTLKSVLQTNWKSKSFSCNCNQNKKLENFSPTESCPYFRFHNPEVYYHFHPKFIGFKSMRSICLLIKVILANPPVDLIVIYRPDAKVPKL